MAGDKKTRLQLLIDQCLTPDLAEIAKGEGMAATYVGRVRKLYGKPDQIIARYALSNELTLVTNDMFDFKGHYHRIKDHPGVICLTWADQMLQSKPTQIEMFKVALHFIQQDELYQEILQIRYHRDSDGDGFWEALRSEYPHWA